MNIWDIALMAGEGVKDRKFRFALNLIGVLIGCAAVTGLISVTQGLNADVSAELGAIGATTISVRPGGDTEGPGSRGTLGPSELNWRDLDIIKKIPGIDMVAPVISNKFCEYTLRGTAYGASITGVTDDYFRINKDMEIATGRLLLRSDKAAVIIGSKIAQPEGEDKPILGVGDRIKVTAEVVDEEREITLRVVGVLKETGGGFTSMMFSQDNILLVPLRTCEQLFDVGGEYSEIQVIVESVEVVDIVVESIEDKFGDDVSLRTVASMQEMVNNILGTMQAVLGGISGISLLVAGVGIINTMTISVMERTREIGVLKAIGAKSRDVLVMFISEAILTGIMGGAIGAVSGFVLAKAVGNWINLPTAMSLDLGILVVGFAVITCVLSGLYPAWRASNLNPVEALRYGH